MRGGGLTVLDVVLTSALTHKMLGLAAGRAAVGPGRPRGNRVSRLASPETKRPGGVSRCREEGSSMRKGRGTW